MNSNCSNASFWPDNGIILYDGVCVLCSGWMRSVLRHDHQRLFRFTPIQSDYGRALAQALGINPDDPDTNALLWNGVAYRRSDAALRVVSLLPGGATHPARCHLPPDRPYPLSRLGPSRGVRFGQRDAC
jgi:predicted DCC family thiol-disulfide oxidoreductase YuxK